MTMRPTQKDIKDLKEIKNKIDDCFKDYDAWKNDAMQSIIKLTNKPYFKSMRPDDKKDRLSDALDEFVTVRATTINRLRAILDEISENYDLKRLKSLDAHHYYQIIEPASSTMPNCITVTKDELVNNLVTKIEDELLDEDPRLALNLLILTDNDLPFDNIVFPVLYQTYLDDDCNIVRVSDKSQLLPERDQDY